MENDGRPVVVLADVETQVNEQSGREEYKSHKAYFSRLVAPSTFYAYEEITLGANVDYKKFFADCCPLMKGARLYVSTNAQ